MDGTILITGSSNSSGYGGSATTTPTTPLGSYDARSLSTPTPTAVATVATITPNAVSNGMHTMLHQQQQQQQQQSQHHNNNIPVATVAAVTPFYSEALNNLEFQQQQTYKHTQRQQQQQQQQQQYYQTPHNASNYATTSHFSDASARGVHSMESQQQQQQYNTYDTLMERSASSTSHLRRHSVCLAPSVGPTSNMEGFGFGPPTGTAAFSNSQQNKTAGNKPQAAATPFYAATPNSLISSGGGGAFYEPQPPPPPAYKYKIPTNMELTEFPYQQHAVTYFPPPTKSQNPTNYGAVVPLKSPAPASRQPSNLFEKYEKYLPNNNTMGRGNYNTPYDADIYTRHKPTASANFIWNVHAEYAEYVPPPPPAAATSKYNNHAAYYTQPTTQTMWSNTPPPHPPPPPLPPPHYMERLPPAYHHQQYATTSPYMQQTGRNNYQPYQQTPQPFYASRRPSITANNNGMLMHGKFPPDFNMPHHALNKPKMSNDLHFGAATYDMPAVAYNYATNNTPPNTQTNNWFNATNQQHPQQQQQQQSQPMYVGDTTNYMVRATEQPRLNYTNNYYVQPTQNTASMHQQSLPLHQQQHQQQQEGIMQIDYTQNNNINNCYLSPAMTTNLEMNENCNVGMTMAANYADQFDINGTRSSISTTATTTNFCNNNDTNVKDNNNLIDNQAQVTLGKSLSIRDFLTSWNDDEEDFAASVDDFSFMENDKNKTSVIVTQLETIPQPLNYEQEILFANNNTTDDLVMAVDAADTSLYTNLPDIVIDIEKASTTTAENKTTNFANFDVEMELDQLQSKRASTNAPVVEAVKLDAFSKCLERADFNANIEANLRKVAEKLSAHIEERLQQSSINDEVVQAQTNSSDRSAFEKEYKTFIKTTLPVDNQYKSETNTGNQLHKLKRKLSNNAKHESSAAAATATATVAKLSTKERRLQLWHQCKQKRVELRHYLKIVKSLSGQQAYRNLLLKKKQQNIIKSSIMQRNLINSSDKIDKILTQSDEKSDILDVNENSNSSSSSDSSSSSNSSTTTTTTTDSSSNNCSDGNVMSELKASSTDLLQSDDCAELCGTTMITVLDDENENDSDKKINCHAFVEDKDEVVDLMKNSEKSIEELDMASPKSIVSISSDVGEECYGFGSGEEGEAFQIQQNKRKDAMEIVCQRLLESSAVPKLGELCANSLNDYKFHKELSVEEALEEMYRNAGVLSDDDNNQSNVDTEEVLIINLQEILNDGDTDVYLLQCDVNDNILAANTNMQTDDIELVHILNEDENEEEEDNHMALGSGGTNSPCPDMVCFTPIPTIHHEEIVPDNYIKYKKESFLKYLHAKYVQNHLSKFHCAQRILKKYKRQLPRKLFKNS